MTNGFTAYLAPRDLTGHLVRELKGVFATHDRLVLAHGEVQSCHWVQNIWYHPEIIPFRSINDAAQRLCSIQRNWWPYEYQLFRRCYLIQKKLPHVSAKPLDFLESPKASSLGSYALLDEHTMIAAGKCSSPVPNGEWRFNEDRINPPSRAYLKLWELFTRFCIRPDKDDVSLDLGASPGGWTFVLAKLAGRVIAYDRSALDPRLMKLPNIKFLMGDAFKINPLDHDEVTWIFSDVVCYPHKLYDFLRKLLGIWPDKNYVFTVKFQGEDQDDVISLFAELPGQLVHLSHNKHELTWFKVA